MELNEKIKKYRRGKKISQKQLAQETGVSTSYIQQLELGQKVNPSLEVLIKIAKILDVDLNDLSPNAGEIINSGYTFDYSFNKSCKDDMNFVSASDAIKFALSQDIIKKILEWT